ncbi:MAG: hypothetical protein AAF086_03005 [Planctomycetota bacterium]
MTIRWPAAIALACLAGGVAPAHGENPALASDAAEPRPIAPESPGEEVESEAEAKSYWMAFDATFNEAWLNPRNVTVELVDEGSPYLLYAAQDEGMGPRLWIRRDDKANWDVGNSIGLLLDVTNKSGRDMAVEMRVDGPGSWGEAPTVTGRKGLMPDERGEVVVRFDRRYGRVVDPPVDPKEVRQLLIFITSAQPTDQIWLHGVSLLMPPEGEAVDAEPAPEPTAGRDAEPAVVASGPSAVKPLEGQWTSP